MAFDEKPLQDVTENDLRNLIRTGRVEGPTLEYKSEIYGNDDQSCREFLQDVCMFANAGGGTIVIGINELRDSRNELTGSADPNAEIGIDIPNAEQQLLKYENRILDCIDERLPVESAAVQCANGKYVLLIRVPNSLAKPHRVSYKGNTYFPSRRERRKYDLDAREIKELAMRTASQLDRAESVIDTAISDTKNVNQSAPVLSIALLPVFFRNFVVNLKGQSVFDALLTYALPSGGSVPPVPSFEGLTRQGPGDTTLTLAHNGLFKLRVSIPTKPVGAQIKFYPKAIDRYIRSFVTGVGELFDTAGLSAPALLGTCLLIHRSPLLSHIPYVASYGEGDDAGAVRETHKYPLLQITTLGSEADPDLRNLCDLIHQTFGRSGSTSFDANGKWREGS